MKNYQDEAKELLKLIGGKENVASVTHCATRLRFALVDEAKASPKDIQKLDSVKGTFTNAGQFQVIIGNDVGDFYKDFIRVSGIEGATKEDVKKAAMTKQPFLQRMVAHLAEIFVPLIPALVAGGLMLGLGNFLQAGLPFLGVKEVIDTKPVYNSFKDISEITRIILFFTDWIGGAVFGMLPVLITWSTVRKFKGNEALGIVLGLMLVAGGMLNAYVYGNMAGEGINIKDALLNGNEKYGIEAGKYILNLGLTKITLIGYQAQVLPAMFTGIAMCYIEKFFNKRTPEVLKLVWVPFITLVVTGFLTIIFIGPVARTLGEWLVALFAFLFKTPGLKYIGALYIFWLTIIKPSSKELFVQVQALFTVFFGFSALYSITYGWNEALIFILAFLLGYSTIRHIMSSYADLNIEIFSLFWGLIVAEFAWIFNFLVIGYRINFAPYFNFVIPQAAIILTVLSFIGFNVIVLDKDKERERKEFLPEVIFATILILTLLLFFSSIPVVKG